MFAAQARVLVAPNQPLTGTTCIPIKPIEVAIGPDVKPPLSVTDQDKAGELEYIPLLGDPNKLAKLNVVLGFNLNVPSVNNCSISNELASLPESAAVKPKPLLDVSAEPLTAVRPLVKFLPVGAGCVVLGTTILAMLLAVGAVFVILTVMV